MKNEKRFNLKYGYHENYFIEDENGEFSFQDINNLIYSNQKEFFDCVSFENGQLKYNDCNCRYSIDGKKTLNDFLNEYANDIEEFFKIDDFLKLCDEEKFKYLSNFFDLCYIIQDNPLFIEVDKNDFEGVESVNWWNEEVEIIQNEAIKEGASFVDASEVLY